MPYEEDKILHDELVDVKYKFRLKSALLVPATFSLGEKNDN